MAFNKRPKRDLATKMMSPQEKKKGISPFFSKAWLNRKSQIEKTITNKVKINRKKKLK